MLSFAKRDADSLTPDAMREDLAAGQSTVLVRDGKIAAAVLTRGDLLALLRLVCQNPDAFTYAFQWDAMPCDEYDAAILLKRELFPDA